MNSIDTILQKLHESRVDEEETNTNADYRAMVENPTYKKTKAICEKYKYDLQEAYVELFSTGGKLINLSINTTEKMQPDVYFNVPLNKPIKKENYEFRIQTTSYGSLTVEQYKVYLDAVNNAYAMIEELSKLDFTTLYEHEYTGD